MMKHKHSYNIETKNINPQHNGMVRDVAWKIHKEITNANDIMSKLK